MAMMMLRKSDGRFSLMKILQSTLCAQRTVNINFRSRFL